MNTELSCRPLRAMLLHFRRTYGPATLQRALQEAQLPEGVDLPYLEREDNWLSFEVCARVVDALCDAAADPAFPREAGLAIATPAVLGLAYGLLRAFGTPQLCYQKTFERSHLFNRVGTYKVAKLTRTQLSFSYCSTVREPNRRFCEYRMGSFAAFPTLWKHPPAQIRELRCQVEGAPACEYEVEWALDRSLPLGLAAAFAGGAGLGACLPLLGLPLSTSAASALGAAFAGVLKLAVDGWAQAKLRDRLLASQSDDFFRSGLHLMHRFEEVERLNATLEGRVEQRTRELAETTLQLQQALARQKELDELKTRFFTNLNHDLRGPLTVVNGALATLGSLGASRALPEHAFSMVKLARKGADRLEGMVNDMLDLAKLDAGIRTLDPVRADVAEMIRGNVEGLASYAAGLEVSLHAHLPEGAVPADVDPNKLERVLMNLLTNACKFSRPGGVVMVTLREEAEQLRLTVADRGVGIPAEELPLLFERFSRGSREEHRRVRGTGLGLAVVKEFVALHGGTVAVESQYGEGTTFTVALPRWQAEVSKRRRVTGELRLPQGPVALPPRSSPQGAPTVVVIEDNPDISQLLAAELSEHFDVLQAPRGALGVDAALRARPSLVICDLVLPDMDGLEVCRRLRAQPPTRALPLLVLSAKADAASKLSAFAAGADDFLAKPFDPRELSARVDALLRRSRMTHPEGPSVTG